MSMPMTPNAVEPQSAFGRQAILPILVSLLAAGAHAQSSPSPTAAGGADAATAPAGPQNTQRRALVIEPRVVLTVTATDNGGQSGTGKHSDVATQVAPGIRMTSTTGRLRGYFDYSLTKIWHSNNEERSQTQNALTAFGTAELVDNWAFVDLNGNISRQTISAFGAPTLDPGFANRNATEVSTFRFSPYIRGRTVNQLNYEARYTKSTTRSKSNEASDVDSQDVLLRLGSDPVPGKLSWTADVTRQDTEFSRGRETQADRIRGVLTYSIGPQVNTYLIVGRESNNYVSVDKQSHSTSGLGATWSPSDRTRLLAESERRFFGHTHKLSAEYRTPRTVWKFTDAKDVTTNPGQGNIGSIGTVYDLYFSLFASIQPDPILRAQMVTAFLQANGLNPNAPTNTGFLASAVSLQRRQDLSFAISGVRDTVTVVASRSETRRLEGAIGAGDDLSLSPVVQQRLLSLNYGYRLTPDTSLNLLAMHQKTAGAMSSQASTFKTYNVSLSSRLGLKVTGTVGVRRSVYDGAQPYTENAVTGTLNVQF